MLRPLAGFDRETVAACQNGSSASGMINPWTDGGAILSCGVGGGAAWPGCYAGSATGPNTCRLGSDTGASGCVDGGGNTDSGNTQAYFNTIAGCSTGDRVSTTNGSGQSCWTGNGAS